MSEDNNPFEVLEDQYLIESEEEWKEFEPDAGEDLEFLMKMRVKEDFSDDVSEELEGILDGWAVEAITLTRLWNEVIDELNKWDDERRDLAEEKGISEANDELNEAIEAAIDVSVADEVLQIYTLANEVLRGIYGDIIYQEVLSDNGYGEESRTFARNLDQPTQENLLYHIGYIDQGLKGELVNIRRTRNKLVHDVRERQYLKNIPNIESMLDSTFDALNQIHREAYGKSPFPSPKS